MIKYFKSVGEELKKITWLTPEETARDTSYVIMTSLIFSAILSFFGLIFTNVIQWLLSL